MNRALTLVLSLTLWVGAASCERPEVTTDTTPDAHVSGDAGPVVDLPAGCGDFDFPVSQTFETDDRVATVLGSMGLTEKIQQMAGYEIGAELFATPDNTNLDIRGFRFRDGPRGVSLESGTATCFPVPVSRAATWNLELERQIGEAAGREVRGLGHNFLLSPCINTLRHPGWGRGQETYGEDPWFLGAMGTAHVQGVQAQVPACVKHYAGNNIEDTRMTNDALIEERNLRENYLRQFQMVVRDADPACVMSAYNQVNGAYCSENAHLLRDVLKGEWAFDGFVVSDWFAAQSTVESAHGGLDVEMPWPIHYEKLEQAVTNGQVPTSIIDDAVTRILRTKFKHGIALLSEPYDSDPTAVESEAHIALALEASRQGMVLLKNEGEALPLDRETVGKIAVVGAWADEARLGDNGSSRVTPSYAITPYQGIEARGGDGVEVVTSEDATAAQGADVAIVVVALTQEDEGEAILGGGDRDELEISADQEALINEVAGIAETTIVVLEAGGPITMENWKAGADAIVMAWYPGMEGGHALGDVLFGDENFSGRLPQTWPVSLSDEPVFGNHQAETTYEYYHGYRHFDHHDIEPLFPFGYGLSYTSFAYSELVVPCAEVSPGAQLLVSVDVENTGERAGVEVVQLYVSYEGSAVERAAIELKGFARVSLEASEKKTVEIPVRVSDLAYFHTDANTWVVEPIAYGVHVGPNARDLPLNATFSVVDVGQVPAAP